MAGQKSNMNDRFGSPATRYYNRELSWLGFNERVLDEAFNERVPLLERVRFLAITARNLDEFFQVRVGSLKFASAQGSQKTGIAGMTVEQQLERIRERVSDFSQLQYGCFLDQLEPALEKAGFVRLTRPALNGRQFDFVAKFFDEKIRSSISSLACGRGERFPWLQGAQLCVLARLEVGEGILPHLYASGDEGGSRYLLLPLPERLPRLVFLPSESGAPFILLEDIITMFLPQLCPQEKIAEQVCIRVIRNADFELNEEAGDFFSEMEQLLELREASQCVRLEVSESASDQCQLFLREVLGISPAEIYHARGPLSLADLVELANRPGYPALNWPVWENFPAADFHADASVFDTITARDRLLIHPYQSYDAVVQLVEVAAEDPAVLAIKQTLYRTSRNSRIVRALMTAASNGKNVSVIVELKARFDEERNMGWARRLERAGVNVIYGVRGLKTHAKLCIIVRDEPGGLKRYVHFATGNYNESTAELYGDVSFFTCDRQLGSDAVNAFNAITGLTVPQPLQRLSLAPINLRQTILEHIRIETEHAKGGLRAGITAKMNSLIDTQIIDALYEASTAGVDIRLNVRGICCLRPGVPGLSDRIRVVSIVDRYLEHARIFHFRHGGEPKVYIASADWMSRNLDRRIELMVPVDDADCRQMLEQLLEACFRDNVNAWQIQPDGSHRRLAPGKGAKPFRCQEYLWQHCRQQHLALTNPGTTVFTPLRAD